MPAAQKVVARVPSMDTDPIFIAVEMSRSKWVVGAHVPTSDKVSIYTMSWGDTAALFSLIDRLRSRAAGVLGADIPILCCYEAGYEGFWLYRLLTAAGHRVLVIDPASLLVNRRAKRAKTDRIDAKAMIRALMAFNRGEDQVLSAVHIPTIEQDDQRRLMRERQRLVKERTAHSNRIKIPWGHDDQPGLGTVQSSSMALPGGNRCAPPARPLPRSCLTVDRMMQRYMRR